MSNHYGRSSRNKLIHDSEFINHEHTSKIVDAFMKNEVLASIASKLMCSWGNITLTPRLMQLLHELFLNHYVFYICVDSRDAIVSDKEHGLNPMSIKRDYDNSVSIVWNEGVVDDIARYDILSEQASIHLVSEIALLRNAFDESYKKDGMVSVPLTKKIFVECMPDLITTSDAILINRIGGIVIYYHMLSQ